MEINFIFLFSGIQPISRRVVYIQNGNADQLRAAYIIYIITSWCMYIVYTTVVIYYRDIYNIYYIRFIILMGYTPFLVLF